MKAGGSEGRALVDTTKGNAGTKQPRGQYLQRRRGPVEQGAAAVS